MNNEIDAARLRIKSALRKLKASSDKGIMLDSAAAMVIEADTLLSALTLVYDRLYAANERGGIINRKAENPLYVQDRPLEKEG